MCVAGRVAECAAGLAAGIAQSQGKRCDSMERRGRSAGYLRPHGPSDEVQLLPRSELRTRATVRPPTDMSFPLSRLSPSGRSTCGCAPRMKNTTHSAVNAQILQKIIQVLMFSSPRNRAAEL